MQQNLQLLIFILRSSIKTGQTSRLPIDISNLALYNSSIQESFVRDT